MLNLNTSLKLFHQSSETYFHEIQRFKKLWLQILLTGAFCFLLFLSAYQLVAIEALEAYLISFSSLAFIGAVLSGFTLFVSKSHLDTKVNQEGIQYRFFPFHINYRKIAWEAIEEIYIREYDTLSEYGGWSWGTRFGNKGNAYTVAGRYGLQLALADGRKILIGTQRPIELEKIILQLLYDYEIR